jgi:hypothetical protein
MWISLIITWVSVCISFCLLAFFQFSWLTVFAPESIIRDERDWPTLSLFSVENINTYNGPCQQIIILGGSGMRDGIPGEIGLSATHKTLKGCYYITKAVNPFRRPSNDLEIVRQLAPSKGSDLIIGLSLARFAKSHTYKLFKKNPLNVRSTPDDMFTRAKENTEAIKNFSFQWFKRRTKNSDFNWSVNPQYVINGKVASTKLIQKQEASWDRRVDPSGKPNNLDVTLKIYDQLIKEAEDRGLRVRFVWQPILWGQHAPRFFPTYEIIEAEIKKFCFARNCDYDFSIGKKLSDFEDFRDLAHLRKEDARWRYLNELLNSLDYKTSK